MDTDQRRTITIVISSLKIDYTDSTKRLNLTRRSCVNATQKLRNLSQEKHPDYKKSRRTPQTQYLAVAWECWLLYFRTTHFALKRGRSEKFLITNDDKRLASFLEVSTCFLYHLLLSKGIRLPTLLLVSKE